MKGKMELGEYMKIIISICVKMRIWSKVLNKMNFIYGRKIIRFIFYK